MNKWLTFQLKTKKRNSATSCCILPSFFTFSIPWPPRLMRGLVTPHNRDTSTNHTASPARNTSAIMCQNQGDIGPMLAAMGQYRPGCGTSWRLDGRWQILWFLWNIQNKWLVANLLCTEALEYHGSSFLFLGLIYFSGTYFWFLQLIFYFHELFLFPAS